MIMTSRLLVAATTLASRSGITGAWCLSHRSSQSSVSVFSSCYDHYLSERYGTITQSTKALPMSPFSTTTTMMSMGGGSRSLLNGGTNSIMLSAASHHQGGNRKDMFKLFSSTKSSFSTTNSTTSNTRDRKKRKKKKQSTNTTPRDQKKKPFKTQNTKKYNTNQLTNHTNNINNGDDEDNKAKKKYYKSTKPKQKLRVDRILSNRGVGTRSEVQKIITGSRVTMKSSSNNAMVKVKKISERIPIDAMLYIDGALISPTPLLLMYHKPKGVLSAMSDDKMGRKHLGDVLEQRYIQAGLHPVGRLDYDTSGLILFSSDGQLTCRLLHPKHAVEKEYLATVEGTVDSIDLETQFQNGIKTAEGTHTAKLLQVTPLPPSSSSSIQDDEEGTNANTTNTSLTNVRLVVSEGKHRMVRRMLANVGHPVKELARERYGILHIGDLPMGEFRLLEEDELDWAKQLLFD